MAGTFDVAAIGGNKIPKNPTEKAGRLGATVVFHSRAVGRNR
jgi:hypothetical protein